MKIQEFFKSSKWTRRHIKTYWTFLVLILVLGTSTIQKAAAEAADDLSWDTFLTSLLGSIDDTGRFDIPSKFVCRRNSDVTQYCIDHASHTSFRFKSDGKNDVLSIDVVLLDSKLAKSSPENGFAGVTIQGLDEFLNLRSKFERWKQRHAGREEDCQVKMSKDIPEGDPTQYFSVRNPETDTAILLLFPNSDYEKAVSMGIKLGSGKGQLVGTILVVNSLDIKCKT